MILLFPLGGMAQQPEVGLASYYADKFEGRKTASGVIFHQDSLYAAHPNLPFGTRVTVINLKNKKSVTVKIVDRGPHVQGRIIDLSKAAMRKIGGLKQGLVRVKISPAAAR